MAWPAPAWPATRTSSPTPGAGASGWAAPSSTSPPTPCRRSPGCAHLPRFADHLAWARALGAELPAHGITPHPAPPQIPTFQVFATGDAEQVNERVIAVMAREDLQLTGLWHPAAEPGRVTTELACSASVLAHDPARIASLLGEVVG